MKFESLCTVQCGRGVIVLILDRHNLTNQEWTAPRATNPRLTKPNRTNEGGVTNLRITMLRLTRRLSSLVSF
jgi:hypothetical protein